MVPFTVKHEMETFISRNEITNSEILRYRDGYADLPVCGRLTTSGRVEFDKKGPG